MRPNPASHASERAQIAGIEAIPLGFLILVVVTLMITSAWTVIDSKLGVTAAAREGARAYVEADPTQAADVATARALEALSAYGRDTNASVSVATGADALDSRCGHVSVTVTRDAATLTLPWIGGLGGNITTQATHSELLDAFRSNGVCS